MTHPSRGMVYINPHFYSSSAARPLAAIGSMDSLILLLRAAVDMEVHGGWIEARSVTNHVTLRRLRCDSRRQRAERMCKTKLLLPQSYVQLSRAGPHCPRGMAKASSGPWSPPPMLPTAGRGRRPGLGRGGVVGGDPCCLLIILT